MTPQVLAILIPTIATLATAVIGAIVTVSGRKRERKVTEIYEAFDERGKLVDSLKESRDENDRRIKSLEDGKDKAEKERDECKADVAELRAELKKLERELTETQEMVGVPRKRQPKRRS